MWKMLAVKYSIDAAAVEAAKFAKNMNTMK